MNYLQVMFYKALKLVNSCVLAEQPTNTQCLAAISHPNPCQYCQRRRIRLSPGLYSETLDLPDSLLTESSHFSINNNSEENTIRPSAPGKKNGYSPLPSGLVTGRCHPNVAGYNKTE